MRLLFCGVLLGTVACLTAGLLNADQPEKKDAPATRPPWQRLLGKMDQSRGLHRFRPPGGCHGLRVGSPVRLRLRGRRPRVGSAKGLAALAARNQVNYPPGYQDHFASD